MDNCFDCVISAYEYVAILEQTLNEVIADVEKEIQAGSESLHYFQVVRHNLAQCEQHMRAGKRCLNNLRRLEKIG